MTPSHSDNNWQWQEPGTTWKGVGLYHITLTIPSREPLLGTLLIPGNDPKEATVEYTALGRMLVNALWDVPNRIPEIQVLHYCLMPDHIHAVWYVREKMPRGIKSVVQGFWQGVKKIGRAYSFLISHSPIDNSSIAPTCSRVSSPAQDSSIARGVPDQSRGLVGCLTTCSRENYHEFLSLLKSTTDTLSSRIGEEAYGALFPIFTEMPHIRPMGQRRQLPATIQYIINNPQRLATKRIMPGFFRVQEGIEIAGRSYSGVGNIRLLHNKCFAPVHVRSMWVKDAEQHGDTQPLRDYINACILAARQGTVMVSPFISPKEKEVMSVLLAEKHPFILLSDNGFRDYYKPTDALFDAVAEGRVFILSPWEHDPDKHHISREDCVALNGMAEAICSISHS